MSIKQKIIVVVLIALIITVYSVYFLKDSTNAPTSRSSQTQVEVIAVQSRMLSDQVKVLGSSYANESVNITSNITETISSIQFTDGQLKNQGDVIAVLEQSEEQAQLKAAELQLQEHNRELKRLEQLIEKKAVSIREYDERLTRRDITLQVIEEIKARIGDRTLIAPFDGVVSIRNVSVGTLIRPGDVITTIEDISRIKLDFNVPSRYLSQLNPGIKIEAKSEAFPDIEFIGQIETINNKVDPVTRSILVRAVFDNANHQIRSGMLMMVNLLKNERESLVVPEESVVQKGDEKFVMVVGKDNIIQQRQIETGMYQNGLVEVTQFLTLGELVVVRGVHKVQPNATVSIRKEWPEYRPPQPGTLKGN